MSEIARTVVEVVPYAGIVVGSAIGAAAEVGARKAMASNRSELLPGYGDIEGDGGKQSKFRFFLATTALVGAVAGFGLGEVVSSTEPPEVPSTAAVMVVDHAREVATSGVLSVVNQVAVAIARAPGLNVSALLARNNTFTEARSPADITNDVPYWGAPVSGAVKSILVANGSSTRQGRTDKANSPILVITNGDTIAESDVTLAKQTNTKVFIVNTGSATDPTAKELATAATDTGGKYWQTNAKNTTEVIEAAKTALGSHEVPKRKPSYHFHWPPLAMALAAIGIGAKVFRERRQLQEPSQVLAKS